MLLSIPVRLPISVIVPLLIISVPIFLVLNFILQKFIKPYSSPLRKLPGPSIEDAHWWWGSFSKECLSKSKMQHQMMDYGKRYGKVWSGIQPGRTPFVVLQDRKAIQYCLVTKSKTFVKPPEALRILSAFFGKSLLGVDGETHKKHRKVAFPPFTQQAVNDLAPCFNDSGKALVERWNSILAQEDSKIQVPPQGHLINAFSEFSRSALDIIGKAGFGYDFGALKDNCPNELYDAFENLFKLLVTGSLYSVLRTQADWVTTIGHYLSKEQKEVEKQRKIVDDIASRLVDNARDQAVRGGLGEGLTKDDFGKDLLSILVRSNLSTDVKSSEKISHEELTGFVPTFLSAGHETTATALSWSSYALTNGERGLEIQRRLREELTNNPDWQNDAQSIQSLPYLNAFTTEVLRMFPPIRQTRREVTEDDEIPLESPITLKDGTVTKSFKVSKGDILYVPLHSLNIESDTWGPDAEVFRPERWLEPDHQYYDSGLAAKASELKSGWKGLQTFAVGPRNCIGMRMAILEVSFVIANVVSNFQLNPPALKGEKEVKVDYRQAVVARPCVEGRENEGHLLPIRITKLKN